MGLPAGPGGGEEICGQGWHREDSAPGRSGVAADECPRASRRETAFWPSVAFGLLSGENSAIRAKARRQRAGFCSQGGGLLEAATGGAAIPSSIYLLSAIGGLWRRCARYRPQSEIVRLCRGACRIRGSCR